MPVTERLMAAGAWSLTLRPETPRDVLEAIDQRTRGFGVLVITPVPAPIGDVTAKVLRTFSRYVGIARRNDNATTLTGASPAILLGDEDGKGPMWITGLSLTGTLSAHMTSIFAGSTNGIASGTITNPTANSVSLTLDRGTTQRRAIQAACQAHGADWRLSVNASGTLVLDAAAPATLWGTPTTVVARSEGGRDVVSAIRALEIGQQIDLEDYSNTVWVYSTLGGTGTSTYTGTDLYFGLEGSALTIARYIETSEIDPSSLAIYRDQIGPRFTTFRRQITVAADEADIKLLMGAGSNVNVYDPLVGLYLTTNPVESRGTTIHPLSVQCLGMTWPIREGMGVYYCWHSTAAGTATDLTPWYVPESGPVQLDLGALDRPLPQGQPGRFIPGI